MNKDIFLVQKLDKNTYDIWSTAYLDHTDAVKEVKHRIHTISSMLYYSTPSSSNFNSFLKIKQDLDDGNVDRAIELFNNICIRYRIDFFSISCIGSFNEIETQTGKSGPSRPSKPSRVEEIECRVCNKKNDKGVTVCWNCGNIP